MWFIYILLCNDNSLYTGITNNMSNRLDKHNSGKGSKYCRARLPVTLKAFWYADNRSEASKLEIKIKKLKRVDKLLLIKAFEQGDDSYKIK